MCINQSAIDIYSRIDTTLLYLATTLFWFRIYNGYIFVVLVGIFNFFKHDVHRMMQTMVWAEIVFIWHNHTLCNHQAWAQIHVLHLVVLMLSKQLYTWCILNYHRYIRVWFKRTIAHLGNATVVCMPITTNNTAELCHPVHDTMLSSQCDMNWHHQTWDRQFIMHIDIFI